jgi:hypothetical protein
LVVGLRGAAGGRSDHGWRGSLDIEIVPDLLLRSRWSPWQLLELLLDLLLLFLQPADPLLGRRRLETHLLDYVDLVAARPIRFGWAATLLLAPGVDRGAALRCGRGVGHPEDQVGFRKIDLGLPDPGRSVLSRTRPSLQLPFGYGG